jgi:serine/threonine kinase 38
VEAPAKPGKNPKRERMFSLVGTPDYIAPEVFSKEGYTETVDWWSLGTIMFEMLVGYPPFFSTSQQETCHKVIDWKNNFHIPEDAQLSPCAIDLLTKLIRDPTDRLGINGAGEIKAHPFFTGINWVNIRNTEAPNVTVVS